MKLKIMNKVTVALAALLFSAMSFADVRLVAEGSYGDFLHSSCEPWKAVYGGPGFTVYNINCDGVTAVSKNISGYGTSCSIFTTNDDYILNSTDCNNFEVSLKTSDSADILVATEDYVAGFDNYMFCGWGSPFAWVAGSTRQELRCRMGADLVAAKYQNGGTACNIDVLHDDYYLTNFDSASCTFKIWKKN